MAIRESTSRAVSLRVDAGPGRRAFAVGVGVLFASFADTRNKKSWRDCLSLAACLAGGSVERRRPDEIKEPQVIVWGVWPSAGWADNAEDAQKSRKGLPHHCSRRRLWPPPLTKQNARDGGNTQMLVEHLRGNSVPLISNMHFQVCAQNNDSRNWQACVILPCVHNLMEVMDS
jgi:hypothetical protein